MLIIILIAKLKDVLLRYEVVKLSCLPFIIFCLPFDTFDIIICKYFLNCVVSLQNIKYEQKKKKN